MLELEDALARILEAVPAPITEVIPLGEAHERVLARPVLAQVDLPPFDNSAMDGYAVRAAEVIGAKPETPVSLRLAARIPAGQLLAEEMVAGTCARLFTGSPLPRGADAVVMQEDTRMTGADQVLVLDAVKPWENVRFRGEDIQAGEAVGQAGEVLGAGRLSLLAAAGVAQIEVGRKPAVALLATGSELTEAGRPLGPGHIYESNRQGLAALVERAGARPRVLPLVADNLAATRAALESALEQCDAVITSGGVSVGEMDFIKPAFEAVGGALDFWRVAIKPGRPFVFGRLGRKLLFGLPGNPVSAFVTFLLLVRPALLRWQGAIDVALPGVHGVVAEPIANPGNRRHFVRVRLDATGAVYSAGVQASHRLGSLAAANGLVDVSPGNTLPAGTVVRVLRWE